MPQEGLVAYTREVAAATDLPVIVYNRNNARYTEASGGRGRAVPNVVGFKDGTGDLDKVGAHRARGHRRAGADGQAVPVLQRPAHRGGITQQAYRAIGVHAVLVGHLRLRPRAGAGASTRRWKRGNDAARRRAAARASSHPLVRLRDTVPGYAGVADQGRRDAWRASTPGRCGRR